MTAIHYGWYRLADLSGSVVHEIIRLRESVFVVEQACAYQEADALDEHAWHLLARVGTDVSQRPEHGTLAAYLRVVDPGAKYAEPSIGRVLTASEHRRVGLGRPLMRQAIVRARAVHGPVGIRISAQCYLQGFYESLGFDVTGQAYLEDDIPHVEMWLAPPDR